MYELYIEGPKGPLEFAETNVDIDGKVLSFFINNNFNPGYVLKGKDFGLTNEALQRSIDLFTSDHGSAPDYLNGHIIKKNLLNFQTEYVQLRDKNGGSDSAEIADEAIKKISFGREREKVGYGDMQVDVKKFGSVEIDGKVHEHVPTSVSIIAKKDSPKG
jgi:hypothetical protein